MGQALEQAKTGIELDFSYDNGKRYFTSLEELETFLATEQQSWEWLHRLRSNDGRLKTVSQPLAQAFTNCLQIVRDWKSLQNLSEGDQETRRTNLQNNIQNPPQSSRMIFTTSPTWEFINQLRIQDEHAAAWATGFFIGTQVEAALPKAISGVVRSVLFNLGISDIPEPQIRSAEKLKEQFSEVLVESQKESEEHARKLQSQLEEQKQSLDEFLTSKEDALREIKKEWSALQSVFKEEFALKAPVQYWADKGKSHRYASAGFLILAALVPAVVIPLVYVNWLLPWGLFAKSIEDSINANVSPPIEIDLHRWQIGILLTVAFFMVWLVRVLVKIGISHVHLCRESEEKACAIETYLSLKESGTLADQDRTLILESIFRYSPSGLVGVDGVPFTVAEAVTKVANRISK